MTDYVDTPREGHDQAEPHDLTTADLEGATVYDQDDEAIGVISLLMVGTNGMISDAVIDVGGFLGLGAHSVRVPSSELSMLRETSGDKIRVYLEITRAELEAMPYYAD